MNYKNEHQRQMDILTAALPYVTPASRHPIQLLLQADSFIQLAKQSPETSDFHLEAAETSPLSVRSNIQEMLLHIQEYLTPAESDFASMLLNLLNAEKLFQNYNQFVRAHPSKMQEGETSSDNPSPNNNLLIDFLLSQLNPEQKATFEQFQNIMYNK